jgi:hypothetical protein
VERPYGGHLVSVLLSQIDRAVVPQTELDEMISGWLRMEDADLERNPASSYYTAILAAPRSGLGGLAGRLSSLAVRARLALRYRVRPALGLRTSR